MNEEQAAEFDPAGGSERKLPDTNLDLSRRLSAAANSLQAALDQFTPYPWPALNSRQQLDLDLSRAVLANASARYSDAIQAITQVDQSTATAPRNDPQRLLAQLMHRTLGDAYSGLHNWQQGLDHYRKAGPPGSATIPVLQRVAVCNRELGNLNVMLASCRTLADCYNARGGTFLMLSKSKQALADFQTALNILAFVRERDAQSALSPELLTTHENLACALLILGQPAAAAQHLHAALRLREEPPLHASNTTTPEPGITRLHLADALLAQLNLDACMQQYDQVLAQLGALPPNAQGPVAFDVGLAHNNRGAALAANGHADLALPEFTAATDLLSVGHDNFSATQHPQSDSSAFPSSVGLDVAVQYSKFGLQLSTRPRLMPARSRSDLAAARAIPLGNSAQILLVLSRPSEALNRLLAAAAIYSDVVEKQGQADLAPEFADTLQQLAWIYATTRLDSVRDGKKAADLARKACDLTSWKDPDCLSALAAACAETGNFSEAVNLQQKAIDLVPEPLKPQLRVRAQIYQSGKPFRS